MLIFENNVHFNGEQWNYLFPYLFRLLPVNFSILYFDNSVDKDIESKFIDYNDLLWKVNGTICNTYAYLISPQGASTLLKFIYPVQGQINLMMNNISRSQSLNVFMSKQILVIIDNKNHLGSSIPPLIIPRIFHFIWLNNNTLPSHIAAQKHIELWKKFHPNWKIQLWTETSIINRNLTIYNKNRLYNSKCK